MGQWIGSWNLNLFILLFFNFYFRHSLECMSFIRISLILEIVCNARISKQLTQFRSENFWQIKKNPTIQIGP